MEIVTSSQSFEKAIPGAKRIKPSARANVLLIIGALSMIIDHIGVIFFPQITFMRVIGRLALPIFAYGVAQGYHHTSSLSKYIRRLLIFGLIAQVPFIFVLDAYTLNILFTFVVSLLLIFTIEKQKYFLAVLVFALSVFAPLEYGLYGVLMVVLFYFLRSKKLANALALTLLTIGHFIVHGFIIQTFAIVGVVFALYYPFKNISFNLPRYFFYWFYPSHLAILLLIRNIMDFSS